MDDYNMDPDLTIGSMTIRSILSSKDLLAHPMKATCTEKDEDYNDIYADASAAFLGPNIWDKTVSALKMDYLDLDALLNGSDDGHQKVNDCSELNANEKVHHHQYHQQQQQQPHHHPQQQQHHHHRHNLPAQDVPAVQSSRRMSCQSSDEDDSSDVSKDRESQMYSVDCKFSPTDLALATPPGQEHYDPSSSIIPEEELKPQPIIKKSRKNFVPDNLKDDKYWARRHKNNIAAKRSREARRLKENQIVLRASYLEKENNSLKDDVMRLKAENDMLKEDKMRLKAENDMLRNQLKDYQS